MEFREDKPKWKQLAAEIARRIDDGVYAPGRRIPSVSGLQQEFGVAKNTIYKALDQLRADKRIYTEPDMGSFVMTPEALAELEAQADR
jgi:DNA-binding GntR family transcriptional regulator